MTLPSLRDRRLSAKAFASAVLAAYVALTLDLPPPCWAMTTVEVQPRGATP